MKAESAWLRLLLVLGLAAGVGLVGSASSPAQALNPPGFWECTGPNCPPGTYPAIGNGAIQFRDDSVNVFVGGNMNVTGSAAESEGLTVVLGDMSLSKTGGSNRYDVGEAGVGSRVTPNPGNAFLIVGGDVTVAAGQQIVAGATQNSVARHAGALTGNLNAGSPGSVVQDPAAATSFAGIPAALQTLSTCLAGLSSTGTVTGGASKTFAGDGSSALQIFELSGDIGTATGNGGITFSNIPVGATVVVNVTGAGTKNLKTWAGDFTGLPGVDRERLLWNVTEATDVQMTGVAQWAGSVLVANPASTVVNSYPGLNGRFYALGDVTHTGTGTEFHNYPFIGEIPACDGPAPAPTYDLALQKVVTATTGSPLLATPNGAITFDITVTNQDLPVRVIEVTDYLGVGTDTDFVYDAADQSATPLTVVGGDGGTFSLAWDGSTPIATLTATSGQLDDGESITFPITLEISPTFDVETDGTFDNAAEISRFDDDTDPTNGDSSQAGTGTQLADTDSSPDGTDESNAGETVGAALVDDEIGQDGSGGGDEDDHDIASLPWYDVALIIERNAATSYVLDQSGATTTATFDITVKNQGLNEVRNVDVAHDTPTGMNFTSFDGVIAGTAGVAGTGGSYTIDALAPGEAVTFSVTFTVSDGGGAGSYEVTSEVTEFEDVSGNSSSDASGPIDVDSTANSDLTDDTFLVDPGDPDNPRNSHNDIDFDSSADGVNNFDGDDEDEHDREVVVVGDRFDLALEKRLVTPVQPINPGDTIEWEIIVTNQADPIQFLRLVDYPLYDSSTNFAGGITAVGDVTVSDGSTWVLDIGGITNPSNPFFELSAPDAVTTLDQGETITIEIETTVAATWDGSPLVNWSEIEQFDDDLDRSNGSSLSAGTGVQLEDVDSTPDFDPANDNQPALPGDPTDGEIDQDGKAGAPGADDEDDHDVAAVPIYDLALINTRTAGQPFELSGDDLTVDFDITVKNQGEEIAYLIDVLDHLPAGTSYVSFGGVAPSDDAVVSATTGSVTTQQFQVDELEPGESVRWTITVQVDDSALAEFVNAAEIAAFDDDADAGNGVGPFAVDIDSVPGTANGDIIDESVGVNADDVRNSHNDIDNDRTAVGPDGTGDHVFRADLAIDDEDDHDRELVVLPFDLALRKTLASPVTSLSDGQQIDFVITVFNQGRDVNGIDLADYLGPNFDYVAADNATASTAITSAEGANLAYSWGATDVAATGTVAGTITGELSAGDSVDVPVTLTVDITGPDNQLDNYAEISRFDDDANPANGDSAAPGTGTQLVDVDSTPDSTDASNGGEDIEVDMVDNAIDGDRTDDPTADEDDHDLASTRWFDLSLIKQRSPGQPFLLDPTTGAISASFDITVTNQGPNPNYDIAVIDYLPAGMTFDALGAIDPATVGVTVGAGGGGTQAFDIDQLDPGESVTFTATFEITIGSTTPGRFVNEAEISALEGDFDLDGDGSLERVPVSDIDSTPNATQGDDAFDPGDPDDPTDAANGVLNPDDGHNDPAVDSAADGVNNFDGDDEDDADREAFVLPVDLALRKTFDAFTTSPPLPVGDARFVIEVFNQGLVQVESVTVTDYVQPGFSFDPAENPAGTTGSSSGEQWLIGGTAVGTFASPAAPLAVTWSPTGVATLTGPLAPGESVTLPVVLTVDGSEPLGDLVNKAEISAYDDDGDAGNDPRPETDSTPDDTDDDAQPVDPGDPTDDEIDGRPGGTPDDEDDHDIAGLPVYDLTLVKQRSAGQAYVIDGVSPVRFDITVRNQGTEDVANVQINDDRLAGIVTIDGGATDAALPSTTPAVTRSGDDFTIDRLDAGDEVTFSVVYTNPAPAADGRIVNAAEIESFEDLDGAASSDPGGPQDVDSTPNGDFGDDALFDDPSAIDPSDSHNDIGRDHDGDGDVNEPDPADEDDHDAEAVVVGFDLALRKSIDSGVTPSPLERGDDVTFLIEVFNQGARPVQTVDVTDSFDPSLWSPFAAADNPSGNASDSGDGDTIGYTFADAGPGVVTIMLSGDSLDPGESIVVPLVLSVQPGLTAAAELVNVAEISRFDDDSDSGNGDSNDADPGNPIRDVDSTPDPDPGNDGPPLDDEINGRRGGNPNDEDDHDPARVTVQLFDLALRKRVVDVSPTPPVPGTSKVTFEIEVFNQGSINATDIDVTDYVQDGFTFLAADNQNTAFRNTFWAGSDADTEVTATIPFIFAGRSTTIDIVLTLDDGDDPTERLNFAEISAVDDDGNSSTPPPTDVDSTPDTTNDEVSGSFEDDEIDEDARTPGPDRSGDGTVDEDDHDGAAVELPIFDLALRKVVDDSAANVIAPGGDVTFTIEIHNQGELEANDIDVVDYLPDGMSVSPADANSWSGTTGNVTNTVPGPLAPGSSTSISLVVRLDDDVTGDLVNAAEITAAEDENDIERDDVDSEPNADPDDDEDPVDDEIDNGGGDEDDHDIERLVILPSSLGDTVWFDLDRDGSQDPDEAGVPGVTVELLDSAGDVVDETTTNADGRYSFTGLVPGTYSVRFVVSTLPTGFSLTGQDLGDDARDSDADPATGRTPPTTLDPGEDDPTLDAGIQPPDFDLEAVKDVASVDVRARLAVWNVAAVNRGPDSAIGPITIVDRIPANQAFVEVRNTTAVCTPNAQVVTCVFDTDLAVGESATAQIVTRVAPNSTSIDNVIEVSSPFSGAELTTFENTDTAVSPFDGTLPRTGGSSSSSPVRIASMLVVVGAAIAMVSRRRRLRVHFS